MVDSRNGPHDPSLAALLQDTKNAITETYDANDYRGRTKHLACLRGMNERADRLLESGIFLGDDLLFLKQIKACLAEREINGRASTRARLVSVRTQLERQLLTVMREMGQYEGLGNAAAHVLSKSEVEHKRRLLVSLKESIERRIVETRETELALV